MRTGSGTCRSARALPRAGWASQSLAGRGLRWRMTGHILMTMKPVRTMPAGEFKAKCLEVLDRVARDGSAYLVTKRGRPVARVVPVEEAKPRSLRRSVTYLDDIVEPLDDDWPVDE